MRFLTSVHPSMIVKCQLENEGCQKYEYKSGVKALAFLLDKS
jgi:hypothetical protein